MLAVIIVVVVLIVGGIVYVAWRLEQKRRAALAAFAAQHGFTVVERDDSLLRRFRDYGSPFDVGFDRRAEHIMTGTYDERPAIAFDLTYHTWETRTVDGKTERYKESHKYAIVSLTMPRTYPGLSVSPEGPVGRFFGRLTNTDIQFESDDFNRAFTVNSKDRRFASDIIHPRMMEMLLADCRDVAWEMVEDQIMTVTSGRLDPETLPQLLRALDAVLDQVPAHVLDSDWH